MLWLPMWARCCAILSASAVLVFLGLTGIAGAAAMLDQAVAALRSDPVYVAPGASPTLSAGEADQLRSLISTANAGPIYVAVLPAAARNEAGGDATAVAQAIGRGQGQGTVAVVVGGQFRAVSSVLKRGEAGRLAAEAFKAHHQQGLEPTLADFVNRVARARHGAASGGNSGGGSGSSAGALVAVVIVLALFAGGGFLLVRSSRRRRAAEFAEVRGHARDDLVALGDDIRALDLDVQMPKVSAAAKDDYGKAVASYDQANQAFERARRSEDLASVSSSLEEGRFAMVSAKARLQDQEPPERRPPCFFDPRHGPSVRDVEWAPPGGAPRPVPACAADAQRIDDGLEPDAREVTINGQRTPYWNAPGYYGPWAGGYFGGFGGGLLPGLLIGSLLGGGMGFGGGWGGYEGSGDGGDFGGGGGDFGGGGGGDF